MSGSRSAAVCVGLAAAAHALLLIGAATPPHGAAGAGRGTVSARYVEAPPLPSPALRAEPPAPSDDAASDRAPPAGQTPAAAASTVAAGDAAPPDAQAPAFEPAGTPQLGFPDAPVPTSGARVRVYVELAADGSPQLVSTAPEPGTVDALAAFQKTAQRELQEARFKPGLGSAYCLRASFEPNAPAPRLAWLPGAARDAARCLTGAAPPPQDLPMGTGP